MNEKHSINEAAPGAEASAQESSPLRVVLFAILAIMLLALAYDRLWARRQQSDAVKKIEDLLTPPPTEKTIAIAEPSTISDVRKAIGRAPAEEKDGPTYHLEKYTWRAGLPWKTHDLYVVYTKTKPPMLYDLSVGVPPAEHQFPAKKLSDLSPDELKARYPQQPADDEEAEGTAEETAEGAAEGQAVTSGEGQADEAAGDEGQTQEAGAESEPAQPDSAAPAEEEKDEEGTTPQTEEQKEESEQDSIPSN